VSVFKAILKVCTITKRAFLMAENENADLDGSEREASIFATMNTASRISVHTPQKMFRDKDFGKEREMWVVAGEKRLWHLNTWENALLAASGKWPEETADKFSIAFEDMYAVYSRTSHPGCWTVVSSKMTNFKTEDDQTRDSFVMFIKMKIHQIEARRKREEEERAREQAAIVEIGVKIRYGGKVGKVKYVGEVEFKSGTWVGVEWDKPLGKHDGCVQDKRYFKCKRKHGSMVNIKNVEIFDENAILGMQLYEACEKGDLPDVKRLISEGAPISWSDDFGRSPVFVSSEKGNSDCLKFLAESNANLSQPRLHGETPASIAALMGNVDCLNILAQYGANLMKVTNEGLAPIHQAVYTGKVDCLRILIQNKVDLSPRTIHGKTPLYMAAEYGNISCLKLLIENGADDSIPNKNGKSPMDIATKKSNALCVSFLKEMSKFRATMELEQHIAVYNHTVRKTGKVLFIGEVDFNPGIWVGIAWDKPLGKHDGIVKGKRYFKCKSKHGSMVNIKKVQPYEPN